MLAGKKRPHPEEEAGDVSACVAGMAADVDRLVGSVGRVNGAVLDAVLRRAREAEEALAASRGGAASLWRLVARGQHRGAAAALALVRARAAAGADPALPPTPGSPGSPAGPGSGPGSGSGSGLGGSAGPGSGFGGFGGPGEAAAEVAGALSEAGDAAVALLRARLSGERGAADALVARVRDFLRDAVSAVRAASRRALDAELRLAQQEAAASGMRAAAEFAERAERQRHDEVRALMRMVRLLAARSRDTDLAQSALRRTREHVRLLEQHLDLCGVARAIVPPSFVPPRPPPDAPPEALRRAAPEYFALRLLEHRDVTLSELVDAWQKQERRVIDAQERSRMLEENAAALRRDALAVHAGLSEERQRRELVEHRLADIVRERIAPRGNDVLIAEVTRLRSEHSRTLDDIAQATAALESARADLREEKKRRESAEVSLQRARDDAALDEIADTVEKLRARYDEDIAQLRAEAVRDATARDAALQCAAVDRAAAEEMRAAMRANKEAAAQRTVNFSEDFSAPPSAVSVSESAEAAQYVVEESVSHFAAARETFDAARAAIASRRADDLSAFSAQVSALTGALQEAPLPVKSAAVSDALVNDAVENCANREADAARRAAFAHALQFVADREAAGEASRSALLHAAVADAAVAAALIDRVRVLTNERDTAAAALARCERLIDAHSLTALARVRQKNSRDGDDPSADGRGNSNDVDVHEDSEETAEQIAALRAKNSALDAAAAAAIGEAAAARRAQRAAERIAPQAERIERHSARLAEALKNALAREAALAQHVQRLESMAAQEKEEEAETAEEMESAETAGDTENAETAEYMESAEAPEEMENAENAEYMENAETAEELENAETAEYMENEETAEEMENAETAVSVQALCDGVASAAAEVSALRAAVVASRAGGEEAQWAGFGLSRIADALRDALERAELCRAADPKEKESEVESQKETKSVREESRGTQTGESPQGVADEMNALRQSRDELKVQNEDLHGKLGRLLQMNKQLVEQLKASRQTMEVAPS